MATHSSILAWRIPWTKEPVRVQSMGSQRVGHDWVTITHSLWVWLGKQKKKNLNVEVISDTIGTRKLENNFSFFFVVGRCRQLGEGCGLKPSISLHTSSPVGELWALWIFWKHLPWPSLVAQMVKNSHVMQETWVPSLGWEDPLEEEMATHSSILAWRIPWTGQPGRLQFMGSQSVWHNRTTNTFTS